MAPRKINSIASVTIKDGKPVLTTSIPFAYQTRTAMEKANRILAHKGQPQ